MYLIPAPGKMTIEKEEGFFLKYNSRILISRECDLQVT